jgi:hypothetical protein
MRHGFKEVVRDLVHVHPGLSSDEYAQMALDRGLAHSDSANPVFSLQSTLRKEVREGRMPDIVARKVGGKLHYFPLGEESHANVSPTVIAGVKTPESVSLTVAVPHDIVDALDLLVDLHKVKNRSDALIRFARLGIEAKSSELDRAREFHQQTKRVRESFAL